MWDQEAYIKAWNFTSHAHRKQLMPGRDTPYINHIGLVAMEMMSAIAHSEAKSAGNYQDIKLPNLAVVCALLHDTIEDTDVVLEDILEMFDQQTADGVMALTKNTALPTKREQMLDSLERIEKQPLEISMVKMADRITNLQPPPHYWKEEKIKKYLEEAQIILDALGHANDYLAKRLEAKIQNYQIYLQ